MTNRGNRFQRNWVLPCCYLLLLMGTISAQSTQNRYLAYSTYNPQPGTNSVAAVNLGGLLCVASTSELYQLRSDGTLAYDRTISVNSTTFAVAIDGTGNCYIAASSSSDTPMAVTKYDAQGNAVFSVNYSGSGLQTLGGMAIDGSDNIWIAGATTSNDLQTVNPIQATLKGSQDAFVAEFNSAGALIFSTYFGGSNNDSASALAVDANGNAYFVGQTLSTDFPVMNPLEPSLTGTFGDAFLAKIDGAGSLLYSTYLGTTVGYLAEGIATDASMDMFVPGINTGGKIIVKLNPSGSAVVYATALGGNTVDSGSIAVDGQGNAYTSACVNEGLVPPICPLTLVNPIQSDFTAMDLVGLDPNGNVIFSTSFGNYGGNNVPFLTNYTGGVDSTGNMYVDLEASAAFTVPLLNATNGTYPPPGFYSPCCPSGDPVVSFVAKIALATGASFSMPGTVAFMPTPLGSNQQIPVNIYNTGTTSITISGITISGDYTQTNNCLALLAPATICALTLVFTPSAVGTRNGAVTITDDSPGSPHTIHLTGSGAAPAVTIDPPSLVFASQSVGTISTDQTVTLTDSGGVTLSITRISISGDFAETNTCGLSVPAGAHCTISVTFSPTAPGSRIGSVSITDNAAGSPHTISLSGTGAAASLGLTVASGSSSSQTVSAGSSASYKISIGGQGVGGAATLSCTGAPTGSTCTLSPTSVPVSAVSPVVFTVTVATTAHSAARLDHSPGYASTTWMWAVGLFGLLFMPTMSSCKRILARATGIIILSAMLILLSGCGGGRSGSTPPATTGTPAGTYTLNVTATTSSTSQSIPLTLIVQ